jgi:probable phosphoglycerate mutase
MEDAVAYIEKNGYEFLERLGYKREGNNYRILRANEERVALFCHGAMGRAWIATLLGIPIRTMWPAFNYTHTGVTVLQFKNNENGLTAPRCLVYSDMSHIYADLGTENMLYDSKTKI